MLKRTIASLILLPLFVFVIYGGLPLYILEMVLVAIALHEFYKAFKAKNMNPMFTLGYIFSVYIALKNIFGLPVWYTYAIIFILFLIGIVHILSGKYNVMDCVAFGYIFGLDLTLMFFLGCVGSVIAQLGDLFASSIKRFAGIKDYGKIIPGHGGILDRFDSVLLVAPFVYNAIKFFIS